VTLGQANAPADACGSNQVLVQAATGAGNYMYAGQTPGVVVSWNYTGHTNPASISLRIFHSTADPTVWFTRSASAERLGGSGTNQVHANQLNTFTESPGLPIQTGDVLGLTGANGTAISCFDNTSGATNSDVVRAKNPPAPPVGQNSTPSFLGNNPQLKLGISAVVEPDADGDNFGDESQDSCPTDPAVHSGGCPVDVSVVKTASPNPKVGDALTYTLTVKNNSAINPANGVSVVDTLPAGVTFFAASPGCTGTTTVICAVGALAAGQTATLMIIVQPTASGALSNTASATTTSSDTDANNNSSTVLSAVAPAVPVVTNFKLKPTSFVAASSGGSIVAAAKKGTVVTYGLNTAATTTFTVLKGAPGIKSGSKCVKPPKHPPKGAKKCTRYLSIGTFKHADAAGSIRFRYTGRLKGKTLKPASYRLRAVARNVSGASTRLERGFKVKIK
jgi:uncharacterized repeat protein (TIGR01451 family)